MTAVPSSKPGSQSTSMPPVAFVTAPEQPANVGGVVSLPGNAEASLTFVSTLPAPSRARTAKYVSLSVSGRFFSKNEVAPGSDTASRVSRTFLPEV